MGQALNCTFAEGEYQRWYAQVASVFGLKLSLVGRSGVGGKDVAMLVSSIDEPRLEQVPDGSRIDYESVDVSSYIADLLTVRTGLRWYLPTAEDRAAEGIAAWQLYDFLGGVGGEPWSSADEERFG